MNKKPNAPESKEKESACISEAEFIALKDQLQRLQAEFENYIKREERTKEEVKKFATKNILKELITVFDDFERALTTAPKNETTQGFKLLYNSLDTLLKREGITPIRCVGELFNPELHEVLQVVTNNDKEEGIIVEEYQRGYLLHKGVLRASKVKITKRDEEAVNEKRQMTNEEAANKRSMVDDKKHKTEHI